MDSNNDYKFSKNVDESEFFGFREDAEYLRSDHARVVSEAGAEILSIDK